MLLNSTFFLNVYMRGRECKLECTLCGTECESIVHVLWECSAYSSRASFTVKLEELMGDRYADIE